MKCDALVFIRGLMEHLSRVATAVTRSARRQDGQPLPTTTANTMEQLEAQMNQVAADLAASLAREQLLREQNARLEEQARHARSLQESVRQRLFERMAQEKLLFQQNTRLEERARLARDLHDSVKQHVFALAVQIELARSLLEQDRAAVHKHLTFADGLSYQVQQELTALIDTLRPADLQAKGLPLAIHDYTTNWSRQCGITASIALPNTCLLPASIEEALWRVTQEALSNIARHSQASSMQLHLTWTEQDVSLSITDNGQGFEISAHNHEGLGLRSIRERIEQIGGTLLLQSSNGAGTCLSVHCPLPRATDKAPSESEVLT